jgi:hypothetical protein
MANIYTNFQAWMRGLLTAHDSSTENVADQLNGLRETAVDYTKEAADAMAADVTAAKYFYVARRDIQVISADFVSAGTAAANGTNFATIIVNRHDGAGGSAVVAASASTAATSIAAGVPFALTLSTTLTDIQVTAGGVLSFQITKAAAGVVVPAGYVVVRVRYI